MKFTSLLAPALLLCLPVSAHANRRAHEPVRGADHSPRRTHEPFFKARYTAGSKTVRPVHNNPKSPAVELDGVEFQSILERAAIRDQGTLREDINFFHTNVRGRRFSSPTGMEVSYDLAPVEIDANEAARQLARPISPYDIRRAEYTETHFDTSDGLFKKAGIKVMFRQGETKRGMRGHLEVEFPVKTKVGVQMVRLASRQLTGEAGARELASMLALEAYSDVNPIKIAMEVLAPEVAMDPTATTRTKYSHEVLTTAFATAISSSTLATFNETNPPAIHATMVSRVTDTEFRAIDSNNKKAPEIVRSEQRFYTDGKPSRTVQSYIGVNEVRPGSNTKDTIYETNEHSVFRAPGIAQDAVTKERIRVRKY